MRGPPRIVWSTSTASFPRRATSIALFPIDHVGQTPAVEMGTQILTEQVDTTMLRNIGTTGNVGRDENAFVVPEPTVRLPFELAVIDIQGDSSQLSRSESAEQGLFIDDLPARHVGENGAGLHRREGLAPDHAGCLRRPLAADGHAVALTQEGMQAIGPFQAGEAGREWSTRHHPAPGTDDSHAHPGTQTPHLLADAARADDTRCFPLKHDRPIGSMIESMELLVAVCMAESSGEVEKTRHDVLGHGSGIASAARSGHHHVTAPQIPA